MRHDDEARRKKTTIIVFSVFIVLSMVISIFAIVIDNYQTNNDMSYNKFSFKVTDTGYRTKINGNYMDFQYYPSELERINVSKDAITKLNNAKGIVFLFDPNESTDDLQYTDFARLDLSKQLKTPLIFGITQPSAVYSGITILGCENATADYPFIMLNISAVSSISLGSNPNCIIMDARLKDIVAVKDRLVYSIYGVMPN